MSRTTAWLALKTAAITCCKARGDGKAHRDALLAELREEPPETWAWWQTYFETETRVARAGRAAA